MMNKTGSLFVLKTAEQKLCTMMTDPARIRRTDKGDPGKCPVFDLHKVFSTEEERAWATEGCTTAGIGCIDCKKVLIAHVMEIMEPIWEKRENLKKNPGILNDAVDRGVAKATEVCEETMQDVRKHMGF